jgi:hypothetical protein
MAAAGGFGIDDTSRNHLRNIDLHISRLIDQVAHGQANTVQELRGEIRMVARTLAAIAEAEQQR